MRAFNVTVFDGWVTSTVQVYSDATLNELLGRADEVVVQVFADDSDGTDPKLDVELWYSNDNVNWDSKAQVVNDLAVSAVPVTTLVTVGAGLGGFVRFGLAMAAASTKARVKLIIVGRYL